MSQFYGPLLTVFGPPLLAAILAWLTVLVKKAFEKMPSAQRALLSSIVQTGVAAAEQTGNWEGLTSAEKLSYAQRAIAAQLAHFGMSVPSSVIDPLIQEAVLIVNLAQSDGPTQVAKPSTPTKG